MGYPAYRGCMKRLILDALGGGPMALGDVVAHVVAGRSELTRETAYQRTAQRLYRMKLRGLVKREGRAWRITPPSANTLSIGELPPIPWRSTP